MQLLDRRNHGTCCWHHREGGRGFSPLTFSIPMIVVPRSLTLHVMLDSDNLLELNVCM